MKSPLQEFLALGIILAILLGLPYAVLWYDKANILWHYPQGARIVNLTAKVNEDTCLWTLENINGLNYWWKKFKFAEEIPVSDSQPTIFRIKSADVTHSFAIPISRIGPYEIEAGKVKDVQFNPQKQGSFLYLCWLWCSKCHEDLKGKILAAP